MRTRALAGVLCAVFCILPATGRATGGETLTVTGSILVGHPATSITTITERLTSCDPIGRGNGLDGAWVDLLSFQNREATLSVAPTLDADVYFYTRECSFISGTDMALNGLGGDEIGTTPADAGFALVAGFLGTGTFTLVIGPE
jgi:hypothetical protein